ncbi:hypothetical protein [Clostridium akagii]|uniref:hypothetical protein n=1 Tax=Clostridium akagii TaxID=91623 RepID=UPI00047A1513|nr:hypothetical protein [Clostridium akagii]
MNIYFIILTIISIIYGVSSILAGALGTINHKKSRINIWSVVLMIIGGLIVITAPITKSIYLVLLGLAGIHVSAISNGKKMHGKLNIGHHLIRLIISIVIVTLCVLGF